MINWNKFILWCALLAGAVSTTSVAAEATASDQAKQLEQKFPLTKIVLVESAEAAQQPVSADPGFVVATGGLKMFNVEELARRLDGGQGRPIDSQLLGAIVQVVSTYIRQNDFPVADIVVPDQNIREGVLRLIVTLGKFREIKTKGNHWFSESMLQTRLGFTHGETIRLSELERSIAWANNTNPFRQLKLHIEPVPNTGEFDVIVGVQERLPLRFTAGYDNTGNDILGHDRYSAAVTYGNMWGRDHQLTYGFITTHDPHLFKAHTLSYQAPLAWRHVVQASVSYVRVNPTFLEGFFHQRGESIVADAKYIVPFKGKRWQGEISAAAGFRQSNNNLEFSGIPFSGDVTDSFTGALAAAAIREDTRGKWITSLTLTGSPGTFNSRSRERVYQENRIGSNPMFAHGALLIQRSTILAPTLASTLRATGQIASTNLLASEQFSIGGMGTVRGYKERILAGDHGYMFTHELQKRLPSLALTKRLPKLDTAAVFFWDYGRTIIKKPLLGERKSDHLASAGLGLRASMANNFSASVDYARQLEEVEIPGEPHHRIHVKVTLSY